MSIPTYLAPGFLALPSSVATVVLQQLPRIDFDTALTLSQVKLVWAAIAAAQFADSANSAVLAEWAVSCAAYCPDIASAPEFKKVDTVFGQLEAHHLDYDSGTAADLWRKLPNQISNLR